MDIYVDADGLIYVTDQIPRLSVLATDGRLVGALPAGAVRRSRGVG